MHFHHDFLGIEARRIRSDLKAILCLHNVHGVPAAAHCMGKAGDHGAHAHVPATDEAVHGAIHGTLNLGKQRVVVHVLGQRHVCVRVVRLLRDVCVGKWVLCSGCKRLCAECLPMRISMTVCDRVQNIQRREVVVSPVNRIRG